MDLVAPEYSQVCLFSEINEQMAKKEEEKRRRVRETKDRLLNVFECM